MPMASGSDVSWPRSRRWSRKAIQSSWLQPAGRAATKARRSACRSGPLGRCTKPRLASFFPFAAVAGCFVAAFSATAFLPRGERLAAFTAGGSAGAGAPRDSAAVPRREGPPGLFFIDRVSRFGDGFVALEHQHGEGGQREQQRLRVAVRGHGLRLG